MLAEFRKPLDQGALTARRNRVLLAGLAALPGRGLFRYPALRQEPPQQGIDQIVVQRLLGENQSGFALELVAVLRAGEQGRQNY